MNSKNTSFIAIIGVLIVGGLILSGVSQRRQEARQTTPPEIIKPLASDPVKLGWMGPLSGDAASYGESIKRSVELAHRQVNANVEIIYE